MSMQLYIKYGSITLDFQADGYEVVGGFYPETPNKGMESISDQFQVRIEGVSGADLRSKINAIRLAFEHAQEHKDDALAANLYYEVDDSGDAWMSKLLGGEVHYDSRLENTWRHNQVVVTIIAGHKPYWDAQDEVQVPLSNGNGTNNTTGLVVFNHDDGGGASPNHHDNWVSIDGDDILGDLPGPTRLEVINSYASNLLFTLWIGHNWTDPDNFTHIWEGEDSTGGSSVSNAGCSGGYYSHYVCASGGVVLFTWTLSDTFLDTCQGRYYKVLARFLAGAPTAVKFRIQLKYLNTAVWQSGQITVDSSRAFQIRDLFTLMLPPWLPGQTNLKELKMVLMGTQNTGSPVDVDIDFLQLTPLDGWRMLECAGYGIAQNERLVDDGVNGNSYIDNGADDNKAGILVGYGNPIALYPGKNQRIYFLMHSNMADTAEILRTISVKLFYHPRRETL